MRPLTDVFTVDEIARAAGVPRVVIEELLQSGQIRALPGSKFFSATDALQAGRRARHAAASSFRSASPDALLSASPLASTRRDDQGLPAAASALVHAAFLAVMIWSTSGSAETAAVTSPPPTRLVFWAGPGPGGGGGGGGRAPKADVRRIAKPKPTPSETATAEPEPLPSRTLISPVAFTAGDSQQNAAQADGSGAGVGAGLDEGTGGGAGGGPFRPGSGIDPPRLLREVKAQYTDEARRRGVTGDVLLEIIVRSDGSVDDVKVIRGLGFGLDERAVMAVRAWKFAPARRRGEPVDVVVEVDVDFSLR